VPYCVCVCVCVCLCVCEKESQLSVSVIKYLRKSILQEGKIYFGLWFQRFSHGQLTPLLLGLW
jgi:hypothetical protein